MPRMQSFVKPDGERHVLPLQLRVRCSKRADEFSAADLTPDQIVGVIHHLHLIGLGVADTEFDGVGGPAIRMGCHARGETTTENYTDAR